MKLDVVSLGCAAIVAGTAVVPAGSASAEPLHILIVHTEEHRIDCLGAYGNKEIKTHHETTGPQDHRRAGGAEHEVARR